jgi:hypothetical protein
MASALIRRSALTAVLATVAAIGSPLLGQAAAASPPKFDPANSTPGPGQSVIAGNETLTAAFDQPITGDQNSFKVFELGANGARGAQLPGTVTFDTGNPPFSGPGDTVTWKPQFSLVVGSYEALLNVYGVKSDNSKDPNSVGTADYKFFVAGKGAPTNLAGPPWVNNQNVDKAPFSGIAAPGLTITVDVNGPDATTGQVIPGNDSSASAVVPTCGGASLCPWTVPVDLTTPTGSPKYKDTAADGSGKLTWTAVGSEPEDSKTTTATGNGPDQRQDTTAPATPTLSGNPTISADSTKVTIPGANDSDADTFGYTITVTDPEGHSVVDAPDSGKTLPQRVIDVSGLDDGKLTIHVDARDAAGNLSGDVGGPNSQPTVQKVVGTIPNLGTSTFTTPAGDTTFADALTHSIQIPSKIDLEFTEPITFSYTDNSNPLQPKSHTSTMCIATATGNCVVGLAVSQSSTGNGIIGTVPKGTSLTQGQPYALLVNTFPKSSCGDVSPGGTDGCKPFSDAVRNGSTAAAYNGTPKAPIYTWTVDTTPPTVTITHLDNPVTSTNLQTAAITGTVDTDVAQIQLTFVSSASGSSPRIATVPVNNNGTWSLAPLPLSGVVDGLLTLTIKATDAAGLSSTTTRTTTLSALNLHVFAGDRKALVAWTKPSLANGAAPHYTLTVKDQSVANSAAQTFTPGTTWTQYPLNGLVNGHVYGVTLSAVDPNGNGPVAVGAVRPAGATTISNFSSSPTITYGQSVTLHGRLTDSAGNGLAGKPLDVYPFYSSTRYGPVVHVTTDSNGYWSSTAKPVRTAKYFAAFRGDSGFASSYRTVIETVRAAVRITKIAASSSSHTAPVTISGSVAPNESGRTVYIYEMRSGKPVQVGSAKLGSSSTYGFTHTWAKGTHYVFARFFGQNGVALGNSSIVKFSRS